MSKVDQSAEEALSSVTNQVKNLMSSKRAILDRLGVVREDLARLRTEEASLADRLERIKNLCPIAHEKLNFAECGVCGFRGNED